MKKTAISIIILCFILGFSSTVIAQNDENIPVTFTLKDAVTGKTVQNTLMKVVIKQPNIPERTLSTFLQKESFTLRLEQGQYELVVELDDIQTQGKDYYAVHSDAVTTKDSEEVLLLPVGSVQGVVKDTEDNVVRGAALRVECDRSYGAAVPGETDKSGSFIWAYVPVGTCQVTATFRDAVGRETVRIEHGKTEQITLKLDTSAVEESSNLLLFFVGVILAIGIIIGLRIAKRKKPVQQEKKAQKRHKITKKPAKTGLTKRQKDVLDTLNDRERNIVEFVLKQPHEESTQAKIRYALGIPKTSLVRIFESLERKKIMAVEKLGKAKKVKLTAWFKER